MEVCLSNESTYVYLLQPNGKSLLFLIDTGASISLVKEKVVLGDKLIGSGVTVVGISGKSLRTRGTVRKHFRVKKSKFSFNFEVLPKESSSLKVDGILGADFFSEFGVDIKYSDYQLVIRELDISLPLLKKNAIVSRNIPPQSRCFIDIISTRDSEVCIENMQLADGVDLIGSIQKPTENLITVIVENNTFYNYFIDELELSFVEIGDVEILAFKQISEIRKQTGVEQNINTLSKVSNTNGSVSIEDRVHRVLEDFEDVVAKDGHVGPPAKTEQQEIFLKPFTTPRYIKQYRLPPSHRDVIARMGI